MIVFQVEAAESFLVVVIEKDNLSRMEQGDPITLNPKHKGGCIDFIQNPSNLRVLIAYEADSGKAYEFLQRNDRQGLINYLMRGYKFTDVDGKVGSPLR